jgi:hypothetical protein
MVNTPPPSVGRQPRSAVEQPAARTRVPIDTAGPVARSLAMRSSTRAAPLHVSPPPYAVATVTTAAHARARPAISRAFSPQMQAAKAISFSRENSLARAQTQAATQVAKAQRQARDADAATAKQPRAAPVTDGAIPWAVTGKVPASEFVGRSVAVTSIVAGSGGVVPVTTVSSTLPLPAVASAASSLAPSALLDPRTVAILPEEQVDFSARASELMTRQMPVLAQRAERLVSRVLFVAGRADNVIGSEEILASAAALGRPPPEPVSSMKVSAAEAKALGDSARAEYEGHGATRQALMLQVRAFGANPLDPEIAGNLAFLLLRQQPSRAEAARQVALYALSLRDPRYPHGRVEDWATFGIASALAGHDRDSQNAFLVSLTVAPNLDRLCRAALDVQAMYGERLRAPIETMLSRAQASGRVGPSSPCALQVRNVSPINYH